MGTTTHDSRQAILDPTLLLVEDDGIIARYVQRCLCRAGYPPPIIAASADEAVALARAERPDLVLMDVVLRGETDGLEAAGRIQRETGAPVVYLTARSDDATRERALASGARGYLTKPFLPQELAAAVARVLPAAPPRVNDGSVAQAATDRLIAFTAAAASDPKPTALEEARADLQAECARFRARFGSSLKACIVTDEAGIVREANRAAGSLLGMAPDSLSGKPLALVLSQGAHGALYEELGRLSRVCGVRQWQTTLCPRGAPPARASLTVLPERDAADDVTALLWEMALVDSTPFDRERRQAASATERPLRALGQATSFGVWACDREGALQYVTPAFLDLLDAGTKGAQDNAWLRLLTPIAVDARARPADASSLDSPDLGSTLHVRDRNGELHAVLVRGRALLDDDGAIEGWAGTCLDVTDVERTLDALRLAKEDLEARLQERTAELGRAEAALVTESDERRALEECLSAGQTALREAEEAVARADRFAAVGRLVAPFAHEINNPLQGVLGCLGLVEEARSSGQDMGRFLEVARRELLRATRVVGQLRELALGLRSAEVTSTVTLADIVSQIVALMEKRCADQGVCVTWEPDETAPAVVADSDAIQQVFLNLMLNALDALPDGGSLVISEHVTDEPRGVRIAFADDGPGVAPELAPRLFTSFVTTKSGGMGLGLRVSHDIITRHGGSLELDTSVARGACFVVWLPVERQP